VIRRGRAQTSRSATLDLPAGEFEVHYTLSGSCYSDPGKLSGPPEDCYPPEAGCDLDPLKIDALHFEGEPVEITSELETLIHKHLATLPLEDYLLEVFGDDD